MNDAELFKSTIFRWYYFNSLIMTKGRILPMAFVGISYPYKSIFLLGKFSWPHFYKTHFHFWKFFSSFSKGFNSGGQENDFHFRKNLGVLNYSYSTPCPEKGTFFRIHRGGGYDHGGYGGVLYKSWKRHKCTLMSLLMNGFRTRLLTCLEFLKEVVVDCIPNKRPLF